MSDEQITNLIVEVQDRVPSQYLENISQIAYSENAELLGRGSTSLVYRVDLPNGEQVAVKVPLDNYSIIKYEFDILQELWGANPSLSIPDIAYGERNDHVPVMLMPVYQKLFVDDLRANLAQIIPVEGELNTEQLSIFIKEEKRAIQVLLDYIAVMKTLHEQGKMCYDRKIKDFSVASDGEKVVCIDWNVVSDRTDNNATQYELQRLGALWYELFIERTIATDPKVDDVDWIPRFNSDLKRGTVSIGLRFILIQMYKAHPNFLDYKSVEGYLKKWLDVLNSNVSNVQLSFIDDDLQDLVQADLAWRKGHIDGVTSRDDKMKSYQSRRDEVRQHLYNLSKESLTKSQIEIQKLIKKYSDSPDKAHFERWEKVIEVLLNQVFGIVGNDSDIRNIVVEILYKLHHNSFKESEEQTTLEAIPDKLNELRKYSKLTTILDELQQEYDYRKLAWDYRQAATADERVKLYESLNNTRVPEYLTPIKELIFDSKSAPENADRGERFVEDLIGFFEQDAQPQDIKIKLHQCIAGEMLLRPMSYIDPQAFLLRDVADVLDYYHEKSNIPPLTALYDLKSWHKKIETDISKPKNDLILRKLNRLITSCIAEIENLIEESVGYMKEYGKVPQNISEIQTLRHALLQIMPEKQPADYDEVYAVVTSDIPEMLENLIDVQNASDSNFEQKLTELDQKMKRYSELGIKMRDEQRSLLDELSKNLKGYIQQTHQLKAELDKKVGSVESQLLDKNKEQIQIIKADLEKQISEKLGQVDINKLDLKLAETSKALETVNRSNIYISRQQSKWAEKFNEQTKKSPTDKQSASTRVDNLIDFLSVCPPHILSKTEYDKFNKYFEKCVETAELKGNLRLEVLGYVASLEHWLVDVNKGAVNNE